MKITEMTNEQAADALIRLSTPFGNICDDEKLTDMIEQYKALKDETFIRTVGKILPQIIGYAFKEHKNDLYEIVGALTGKTTAQVAKMNFAETIKTVRDSYDEVLATFITPSVQQIAEIAKE